MISTQVQTRRWRGARRQGAAAAAAKKRALAHVDDGPRNSKRRASAPSIGFSRLFGEEHANTLQAASNYASTLLTLKRFGEVKALLRKTLPIARRVLGDNDQHTLTMRWNYAEALYMDAGATLDDLREAVETLEDTARIARRVLGCAHPYTVDLERALQHARAALRARETPPPSESV